MLSNCLYPQDDSPLFLQQHEIDGEVKVETHQLSAHQHVEKKSLKQNGSQKLIKVHSSHNLGAHKNTQQTIKRDIKSKNFTSSVQSQFLRLLRKDSQLSSKTSGSSNQSSLKKCCFDSCSKVCNFKPYPRIVFNFADSTLAHHQIKSQLHPQLTNQQPSLIQEQQQSNPQFISQISKHPIDSKDIDEIKQDEDIKSIYQNNDDQIAAQTHWHRPKSAVSMMSSLSECDSIVMERSFMRVGLKKLI